MCLFHDDSQIPRISLIKYEKQSKKSRLRRRKETLSYNQDCIPRKIYSWIETQSLKKKLYSCFLRIAKGYMKDPVTVFIGSLDLAAVHSVSQKIVKCWNDDKWEELLNFLTNLKEDEKVIVFVMRKTRADYISAELAMRNIVAACIHGGRDQEDREQALIDLKSGEVRILIATDVASRGLDIDDITHVYNYDFPRDMEEYVHR